jgi:hypothetical protein
MKKYVELGEPDKAEETLQARLAMEPAAVKPALQFTKALMEQGAPLDRAEFYLRNAVERKRAFRLRPPAPEFSPQEWEEYFSEEEQQKKMARSPGSTSQRAGLDCLQGKRQGEGGGGVAQRGWL